MYSAHRDVLAAERKVCWTGLVVTHCLAKHGKFIPVRGNTYGWRKQLRVQQILWYDQVKENKQGFKSGSSGEAGGEMSTRAINRREGEEKQIGKSETSRKECGDKPFQPGQRGNFSRHMEQPA